MNAAVLLLVLPVAAAMITAKKGEDVFDTLPFAAACTVLLLYVLAFFHALPLAGWIAAAGLAGILVKDVRRGARHSDNSCAPHSSISSNARRYLCNPQTLLALALIIAVGILTADRVVVWWDDLNFWASDAKYLWATGGFAGKYGNVSPEFGDYPPALSLWKWLFLSLSPYIYREGLQFSAYHVFNLIFLLPLLKTTRRIRNTALRLVAVPAVFLLPGAVCALQFEGAAADISMGIVYGALLLAISEGTAAGGFRASRVAAYASVLVLIKSSGFFWALCALGYALWVENKKKEGKLPFRGSRYVPLLLPVLTWGSWTAFCLVNRRIAHLTSEAVRFAGGQRAVAADAGNKLRIYLEAFFLWPMHDDRQITLDLPAAGMIGVVIITSVIVWFISRQRGRHPEEKPSDTADTAASIKSAPPSRSATRLPAFLLITGILTYGAILAAHLTIFQGEPQYEDPFAMARSISRYGAPWMLGALMLLLRQLFAASAEKVRYILIALAFLFLTADYAGEARSLITYRATRDDALAVREETIDPEGREFLAWLSEQPGVISDRVLFLRDATLNHSVKDVYISYEACPVPVVYADYTPGMTEEEIRNLQDTYHAGLQYSASQH